MNKLLRFTRKLMTVSCLTVPALSAKAQFTNGNIVVLQAGDGSAALTNASTPVFLKEYNTNIAGQATAVSTVVIPTSGPAKLTIGGTATSEGQITLSADSLRICIAGYDTTAGVATPANFVSTVVNRVVDTVSGLGVPGRATLTSAVFSGGGFRSAVRGSSENYWGSGSVSGTYYLGNTAAPMNVQAGISNTRVAIAANGNLYFSTASGSNLGIYKIVGQPTVTTPATSLIVTGTGSSPYGFAVNATENVVYIADDRTGSANLGGVYRWTLSGSVWTATDTLKFGTNGARAVAVDWSGTYPAIYATTTDNRVIKWIDSNNASHIYTTLATAPTNAVFRGIAFTPKVLPTCTTPVLATSITPYTCTGNGAVNVTVTSGTTPTTWTWTGPGSFGATTQNITGLAAGTYNLSVTTPGGCTATATAIVANNATPPAATITPSGTAAFCTGGSLPLNANTGTGFSYQWSNAAGPIAGATTATYTATAAGSYTVNVSTGVNCSTTSAATVVTVNSLPNVAITAAAGTSFCAGGSAQLCIAGGGSGLNFQWRKDGIPISGAISSCITVTAAGTYSVVGCSTITGCCSTSNGIVITVNPGPGATITPAGSTTFCPGGSVMLNANTGTGLLYSWLNMSGVISGATTASYNATTSNTYKVIVTNSNGCKDTSAGVVVDANAAPPTANITPAGPLTFCEGDSAKLHTNNTSGLTYTWSRNGVAILPGGTDSTLVVKTAGSYTVVVSASGPGCTATSAPVVVTVNPMPVINTVISSDDTLCFGDTVKIRTNSGAGYTYRWTVYNTTLPGETDSILNYAPFLTMPVIWPMELRVVVQTAAGCKDSSATMFFAFIPPPSPVPTYTGGVLSTGTYVAYQWYLNGNPVAGATGQNYTPGANGNYTVMVTNADSCSAMSPAVTVTGVGVGHIPAATIQLYPNPAKDILYIESPVAVNVVLRDLQGRKVAGARNTKQISLSGISNGVYSVSVYDQNGMMITTRRMVKAE